MHCFFFNTGLFEIELSVYVACILVCKFIIIYRINNLIYVTYTIVCSFIVIYQMNNFIKNLNQLIKIISYRNYN